MATVESLLSDILDELRRSRPSAGAARSQVNPAPTVQSLSKFQSALSIAQGTVSFFTKPVLSAANGVLELANAAQDGSAGLGNMANIVSKTLPDSLAIFGRALQMAASIAEKNLSVQQQLGQSGASFSGSLTILREAAARSYLSLDQFAGVVKKNSDIFASLGGNVQNGVMVFSKIQKQLLTPGTETSAMLAALGVSSQEAADLTASFMRSQGSMNKAQLQDQKAVAAAVTQYASELTLLSQITGKSRQELQAKMDAEMQETQFQAYLASLAPEEAAKLRQGLQNAMTQGGQGAVDAFKAMAMGFPPLTEAGRLYAATQQAGMQTLEEYNERAKNAGITIEENARLNREALARAISEGAGDMESMRTVLQASGLSGAGLAKTLAEAQQLQNKFMKDGVMMSKQEIAAQLEAMDADNKRRQSEAKVVQEQQRAFQDLTNRILTSVTPALNLFLRIFSNIVSALGPAFESLGNTISAVTTNTNGSFKLVTDFITNTFVPILSQGIQWFSNAFKDLSLTKSSDEFFAVLKAKAAEAFNYLVENVFKPLWNTIKPTLVSLLDSAAKALVSALIDAINPFKRSKTPETPQANIPAAATGGIFDGPKSGYPAILHGTEAVIPLQKGTGSDAAQTVAATLSGENSSNLGTYLETLNNTSMEMLRYLKDSAENTRRNVEATKNLSGNLYPSP